MITIPGGTPHSFRVDFLGSEGSLTADPSSVRWSLYDGTGVELQPPTLIITENTETGSNIVVPQSFHSVGTLKLFETRYLRVTWETEGVTYNRQISYRVVPFQPTTVSADDVRSYLGLSQDDLDNSEIDIPGAFISAVSEYPAIVPAFGAGTYLERLANTVVLATTVLEVLPGLQLRVIASRKDGNLSISRLSKIDFNKIEADARALRNRAVDGFATATTPTGTGLLFSLTEPTDRFTG